jgi:sarcosine oxidase gamma subunit
MVNRNDTSCRIEARAQAQVLEFIAWRWPDPQGLGTDWPAAAGATRVDAGGRAELLHFAPGRWLAPEPAPAVLALLEAAERAGAGTRVDVTGKWDRIDVAGSAASRLLATTIEIGSVLAGRGCAAVTLFDCPAIIAGRGTQFVLWVQSSYAADFMATATRVRAALPAPA